MAWQDDDIRRSIRRYLSELLDDPWEIRDERREVADEDRPVAVIQTGAIATDRARTSLNQGEVEELLPVTVSCYPALPQSEDQIPTTDVTRQASLEASQLKALLKDWITIGLPLENADGDLIAGPERIPLWDFSGTPVSGDDRNLEADPHDVLWVSSGYNANAIQDPEDALRWSVILNMRVSVERPGRTGPTGTVGPIEPTPDTAGSGGYAWSG